jgi:hypothetical protein
VLHAKRPALLAAVMGFALTGSCALAADPAPAAGAAEDQVVAVLGLAIRDDKGAELGRIVDVLVDAKGQPRAAVIDVGGFLGVGSRRVAVEWPELHFALGKTAGAQLDMPVAALKAAPAYAPEKPVEPVAAPAPAK